MAPRRPRPLPALQQTRLVATCIPATALYSNAAPPVAMPPLQPLQDQRGHATCQSTSTAARAALQRPFAPQNATTDDLLAGHTLVG